MDNPFDIPASGQADWDSGLQQDFYAIERGYHITERAGQAVSSGQVLTLNSGGFFFPYNPASAAIAPHAYSFTAAASGDSLTALAWGIVRSLDINSPAVPGKLAFATASGFLSVATLGLPVGIFTMGRGVLFNPDHTAGGGGGSLASLSDVNTGGLANGDVLRWSDTSSKWEPAVPTTGRTQVGSMDDVLRTAIADGKILQWSDASSKFVFVTPAGGGGYSPNSYYTGNQSGGAGWDGRYAYGVTVTASNVIATPLSGGPYNHTMGGPAKYTGKRYYEMILGSLTFTRMGFTGPVGHAKNGGGNTFGNIPGQVAWDPSGQVVGQNFGLGATNICSVGTYTSSMHLGVAIDFDNQKFWLRANTAGLWNNSVTCNPSSNTGGIDLEWAWSGASEPLIWPAANLGNTSAHALYVRSLDIGAYIPVGFVAWDS